MFLNRTMLIQQILKKKYGGHMHLNKMQVLYKSPPDIFSYFLFIILLPTHLLHCYPLDLASYAYSFNIFICISVLMIAFSFRRISITTPRMIRTCLAASLASVSPKVTSCM